MEHLKTESRVMGIDFGEKRIGIALSDPLYTFAYTFVTLQNSASIVFDLKKIISEKNVTKIILGMPSTRFKSSEKLSEKVLKLKSEIETMLRIEVILWDEEYSSVIATERVKESVTKKSKRKNKGLIDAQSAAVILQEYLDTN